MSGQSWIVACPRQECRHSASIGRDQAFLLPCRPLLAWQHYRLSRLELSLAMSVTYYRRTKETQRISSCHMNSPIDDSGTTRKRLRKLPPTILFHPIPSHIITPITPINICHRENDRIRKKKTETEKKKEKMIKRDIRTRAFPLASLPPTQGKKKRRKKRETGTKEEEKRHVCKLCSGAGAYP